MDEVSLLERDARVCVCGHLSVSHGSSSTSGFVGVGMGPCGVDRDERNSATGWVGDPCPCERFRIRI